MVQTSYSNTFDVGLVGDVVEGCVEDVKTLYTTETTPFGRVVTWYGTDGSSCKLPRQNKVDIIFDADLVTSNSVAGTINGNALTPTVYATSHVATMNAIATKIEAEDNIVSATVGGTSDRTITVIGDSDMELLVTGFVVTLGSSQAGVTYAEYCTDKFLGLALKTEKEQDANGDVQYEVAEPLNCVKKGTIWVTSEVAVNTADTVYVRFIDDTGTNEKRGVVTNQAKKGGTGANVATEWANASFLSSASAGALVKLQVNQP